MDSHPGGRSILKNWAGRESTEEFARYHRNADQCIEDYDYLRIGRMVEETTPDQLDEYEVALNGMVYDLRREFLTLSSLQSQWLGPFQAGRVSLTKSRAKSPVGVGRAA